VWTNVFTFVRAGTTAGRKPIYLQRLTLPFELLFTQIAVKSELLKCTPTVFAPTLAFLLLGAAAGSDE